MPTKFFTNQNDNSLLKKFDRVFTHSESIRHFDALIGYFRTSGYFKVRAFLVKIPRIRILVGINVDMLIKKYHEKENRKALSKPRSSNSFVTYRVPTSFNISSLRDFKNQGDMYLYQYNIPKGI